jgi:hypothetical protein
LRELYSKLILWLVYAKDLTIGLSEVKNLNEYSYEWLRVLKYKYEKGLAIKAPDGRGGDDMLAAAAAKHKSVLVTNKYENFHLIQMTSRVLYDFEYNGMDYFVLI